GLDAPVRRTVWCARVDMHDRRAGTSCTLGLLADLFGRVRDGGTLLAGGQNDRKRGGNDQLAHRLVLNGQGCERPWSAANSGTLGALARGRDAKNEGREGPARGVAMGPFIPGCCRVFSTAGPPFCRG